MIVVNIYGGLGNQLFQYAAGRQLADSRRTRLKLDIRNFSTDKRRTYALHNFNIEEKFFDRLDNFVIKAKERIRKLSSKIGITGLTAIYKENGMLYDEKFMNLGDNVYLDGYWQCEKYFKPIEYIIRKEFMVKSPPAGMNKQYLEIIRSVNAVSIHVRRGDYITDEITNAFHGVCSLDYYNRAIDRMIAEIDAPYFFIFSDDMEWTKANLTIEGFPVMYVDHNGTADYEDLRLMYTCRHHIIANSSFSWWGAWLNTNTEKKVIAPKRWFQAFTNNDIIPPAWITL